MQTGNDSLRETASGPRTDSADSASTAQSSTILVNRTAADGGELSRLPRSDRLTSRVDVSRRTWDIAWPWLPARPDRPSFVESARNTVSKSSPRQRGMAVATAIGLLVAAALAIYSRAAPAVDPERLVVSQWLDAQVAGGTGSDFMQPRTGSVPHLLSQPAELADYVPTAPPSIRGRGHVRNAGGRVGNRPVPGHGCRRRPAKRDSTAEGGGCQVIPPAQTPTIGPGRICPRNRAPRVPANEICTLTKPK